MHTGGQSDAVGHMQALFRLVQAQTYVAEAIPAEGSPPVLGVILNLVTQRPGQSLEFLQQKAAELLLAHCHLAFTSAHAEKTRREQLQRSFRVPQLEIPAAEFVQPGIDLTAWHSVVGHCSSFPLFSGAAGAPLDTRLYTSSSSMGR